MDNQETTGNNPSASADSAPEGKFSFRDLMKAAEEKSNSDSLRRSSSEEQPAFASGKPDGPSGDQVIYELTDIVEEAPARPITVSEFNTEIMKKVVEVSERVAREMFPEIAEKIIREEIAKLKALDE